MKLDFSKVSFQPRWFEFNGAKLKIQSQPRSKTKFLIKDGAWIFDGAQGLETFKFCLLEWEGVEDPEGNPIKLTDSVKEKIYETDKAGIATFVTEKNLEMLREMGEQEKN